MRKILKDLLLVVVVNTLGLATVGLADSITVPGFSFEDPDAHLYGGYTFNSNPVNPAPGWIASAANAGVSLPGASDFSAAALGTQFGYLGGPGNGSLFSANSLTTVLPDTRYTLTVAVGTNNAITPPGTLVLELLVDGTPVPASIKTITDADITTPGWQDYSTSFVSPHTLGMGAGALTIGFVETQDPVLINPRNNDQAYVDNVRLTAVSTLPEPSTIVLGLVGMIAIFAGRMRSRLPKILKSLFLVAFVSTFGLAKVGLADSITVPNFSFEDPVTHSFTETIGSTTTGRFDGDTSGPAANGWIVSSANAGESSLGGSDFSAADLGSQFGYLGGPGNGSIFSAASLATVAPDTRYTLTVAVGTNNLVTPPGTLTLELLVDGTPVPASIKTITDADITTPGWQDYSTSFVSPHTLGMGSNALTIGFVETQDPALINPRNNDQAYVDNVRLTAVSTLPEPSTFVMGGLGVATLVGGWMRQKRGHKAQRAL